MDLSVLFEPFRLGKMRLKNRFVMAPMTRFHADTDSVPVPAMAEYYAKRARGEVALIISEGVAVDHPSAAFDRRVPALSTPKQVAGWKVVTEAVHTNGGFIAAQLWHVGRARTLKNAPFPEAPTLSSGNIRSRAPSMRGTPFARPRAMTVEEIGEVQAAFARSAVLAGEAGFDGVEIHGAHGYLIDQFLWEGANNREDDYGGSLEKRTRFAVELVAAVRRAVGAGFSIIFRFSQWKQEDYDAKIAKNPGELGRILNPLKAAGVDAFHASQRDHERPAFEDSSLNLAGWSRKISGLPSISVGKVALSVSFTDSMKKGIEGELRPIDSVVGQVERGEYDLIAVGRALIADPELPKKLREGRFGEVIPFKNAMLAH